MNTISLYRQKKIFYSWGVLLILSLGVIGEISVIELLVPSIDIDENSQRSFHTHRLASDFNSSQISSENSTKQLFSGISKTADENHIGSFSEFLEPSTG